MGHTQRVEVILPGITSRQISGTTMVDMNRYYNEGAGPGKSQKLPSFANFFSLSTPDETRPVTGEKYLSPTTIAATHPWSKKASSSALSLDLNNYNLCSALLKSQPEQGCLPRRTSLPSISSLISQESHDAEYHHSSWRSARTNYTLAGNRLPPLHNSQRPAMFLSAGDLTLPPVRVPCLAGSRVLPTRLGASDRQLLVHDPSSPSPFPITPDIQRRDSAESQSTLGGLPSGALATSAQKAGNQNNGDKASSSRNKSGQQMYKCPFEGCEQLYVWKENLTRHHTTRHVFASTLRRCPFCKVNAERTSFNRVDNFKEHIRRHMNERDIGRTRTEYHPGAADYYRQLMEETRGERRRGKGQGRRMSFRSDV